MKIYLQLSFILYSVLCLSQDITITDAQSGDPVAFATISFGDGKGTIADDAGVFRFSRKLYKDIDSLHISSIGYEEKALATIDLGDHIKLQPATDQLEAIIISTKLTGKFKKKKLKSIAHKDYHHCWLPTVESEIAVRFNRIDGKPTQIESLQLPIVKEESQASKKGKLRAFSTMIRILFYDVENNAPAPQSLYPSTTYIITQNSEDVVTVDLENLAINIPKKGIYAAVQVLGYTTPDGKLIKAKKYREIHTIRGVKKISTTYRPLLPFTDKIAGKKTWVRRVFLKDKKWMLFDLEYNHLSALVRSGHQNYGIGAVLKVYEKQ